jgi:hypothetical protein
VPLVCDLELIAPTRVPNMVDESTQRGQLNGRDETVDPQHNLAELSGVLHAAQCRARLGQLHVNYH